MGEWSKLTALDKTKVDYCISENRGNVQMRLALCCVVTSFCIHVCKIGIQPCTDQDNLVSESLLSIRLLRVLVLLLPLPRVPQSKAVLEHVANGLQVHSLDIGVEEHDHEPSEETNATVEAKCTTGSDSLHHRKESG